MSKYITYFLDALKGDEERDFTSISINKAIFFLSIPMVFEMFFEALFALVDAFFVARYVGINGVATVGLTESVLTLIYSISWGLSAAAGAVVSRRIGENNVSEASKSLGQVILISLVLGIIIAIPGAYYSEWILEMMGGSPELIAEGIWYTRIEFLSSPVIILLFALSGCLRGAGSASLAMRSVIIANLLNIFLDWLFVVQMDFGVKGAAIATFIGRSVGVSYQFWGLWKSSSKLRMTVKSFLPDKDKIKSILRVASGSTGQFLIQSASWIFLVRILSVYGSEVIAGYTIAMRVIIFTILPSWGLANSAATLVGQNLGAGKPERAIQTTWKIGYINMAFMLVVAVIFFVFSKEFISFFDSTPQVVETGVICLKVLAVGYVVFGIAMVVTQAINGAGDTRPMTIINIICFWIIEIPLAYYLAQVLDYREFGVFLSIIISEAVLGILAIWYFKSNKWQEKSV